MADTHSTPGTWMRFKPSRLAKQILPRGLFGRSLIIIIAPMILLQAVVSYVFFERDLDVTTRRMAIDVAADVAFLIALEDTHSGGQRTALRSQAAHMLRYDITFFPGQRVVVPASRTRPPSTIDKALDDVIVQQMGVSRQIQVDRLGDNMNIRVELRDGVLRVLVPRDRVTVSSPDLFIAWMMGASIILLAVAILFLRNQVRPIERLARAADAFGKGRAVPDFKPSGATEVRRAAHAFVTMRERMERHVRQRTEMLAGVSHDLKTPLTRIRLQLAMMNPGQDVEELRFDVAQMEHMLDEYLDFAGGGGGEQEQASDLVEIVRDAAAAAERFRSAGKSRIDVNAPDSLVLTVKRHAIMRCVSNLISNASKHGERVAVALLNGEHFAQVIVDDDGPGIAEDQREEAFLPFRRLDNGRNLQTGGVGLGLAIARDIARAHGGDIVLSQSALGGLRAAISLPK